MPIDCIPCPEASTTSKDQSASRHDCICEKRYFDASTNASKGVLLVTVDIRPYLSCSGATLTTLDARSLITQSDPFWSF